MPHPLSIFAAGSLKAALMEYVATLPDRPDLLFGPAGLLRERIGGGHECDVFLSANTAHPAALGRPVRVFACNPIRVVARRTLGVTAGTLLDRLLDPAVRLGTSTPGADPSGDYAWSLFDRADQVRPGAAAVLKGKALPVVGGTIPGPGAPAKEGGIAALFAENVIDAFIGYRTSARLLAATLDVVAACALVVLRPGAAAQRFADGLFTADGQALLARHGFDPPP